MTMASSTTVAGVTSVLVEILGISDRAGSITASTGLLGSLPELDSMAVVELVAALESRFGIQIGDDEITGDVFETVGSLADLVDTKLSS
jgi:acyl carrier protein